MAGWTVADMPDQTGRVCVVTGASSGIGEAAAIALAGAGAEVVLAVRDRARGEATRARLLARHPDATATVSLVDLADLASVRAFAARATEAWPRIDLLVNNAGLGQQTARRVTVDGFELQFATNHLGAFALTALLVPALLRAGHPRVVAISSVAHRAARIRLDDLQGEQSFSGGRAYAQSKLANLMFMLALDRRARRARSSLVSVAAHPGLAATGFTAALGMSGWKTRIGETVIGTFGHDAAHGALPGLYAATMPDLSGGEYVGPGGLLEFRGAPAPAAISRAARDVDTQERLWSASERITGLTFPPLTEAAR